MTDSGGHALAGRILRRGALRQATGGRGVTLSRHGTPKGAAPWKRVKEKRNEPT
jgi:hypothetical protein